MQMDRRKFLEKSCKACLLAGAGILISELTACGPTAKVMQLPVTQNAVRMPVTSFLTGQLQIVRPEGWLYNIAVRKTGDEQYEALLLQCTHQQNQLLVNPNGFQCTLHGSLFTKDGRIVKGPAEFPLKSFPTSVEQGQLIIQLKSQNF
jgi:Rieske Fe-S protein